LSRNEPDMALIYRKASIEDLDILTRTRIIVLRAANGLSEDTDMSEVEEQSRRYYKEALADGSHAAYLVFDGDEFVGAGGISFFRVMPTYHNPTGKKAYIMNMYTAPSHRRKGIASRTLSLLVDEARSRGVSSISLEATDMGKPLYKKFGFIEMNNEMELPVSAAQNGLPVHAGCCQRCNPVRDRDAAIRRVTEMENAFDLLLALRKEDPDAFVDDPFAVSTLKKLTDYYEGGQWMADYQLDEQGLLPAGLKRGVLSEDGLYNFLCEVEQHK